jgi:hypothetical protein
LQRFVRGPRRCGNAERDGEVNQFHGCPPCWD